MSFVEVAEQELETVVPVHLDVELTTRCNLSCNMCPFHGPNAVTKVEPEDMDIYLFDNILKQVAGKGTKSIKLNYRGEPLLYPFLHEAIIDCNYYDLEIHVNTNGLLLSNNICELLTNNCNNGIHLLIVSDYGFDKQVENVKRLVRIRSALGADLPIIRVKTSNEQKWLGIADEIETPTYYDYVHLEERFEQSDFKCSQPWQRFVVLASGNVLACSCGFTSSMKLIGNVVTNSIENLWQSKEMQFLRKCHSSGASHLVPYCRKCPYRNNEWRHEI